ncbi:MAG: hypothetical protein ACP5RD_03665 [bacterium]|jgi:hypothetical protein
MNINNIKNNENQVYIPEKSRKTKDLEKLEQTGIKGENININADNVYIINNTNNFNKPIHNNYNNSYQYLNYPPYYYNFNNFYNLFNFNLYNPFILNYFYTTSLFNPYFYSNLLPSYIYFSLFNLFRYL